MRRQHQTFDSTIYTSNRNVKHIDIVIDGYISFIDYVNDYRREILDKIEENKPSESYKLKFEGYIEFKNICGVKCECYGSFETNQDFDLDDAVKFMDENFARSIGEGNEVVSVKKICMSLVNVFDIERTSDILKNVKL